MANEFAVDLGNGVFLDASGNISFTPPPDAQIYPGPEGFHIDSDKVKETFKSLSELLPQDDEQKQKWIKWGVPKGLVEGLASIAGITSIAATSVAVYFWAIGAVLTLMKLVTDDGGLSPAMKAALNGIRQQFRLQQQIMLADAMLDLHAKFEGPADLLMGKVTELNTTAPTGAARLQLFKDMRALVDQLAEPLARLRNEDWNTPIDPEDYKGRAFLSHLLVTVGSNNTTAPLPYGAPAVGFNYRLGITMMLYGFTTFHSMLRTAMPWFRSGGIYSAQLRKCADAIDRFVDRMQKESLARTQHTPKTLLGHEVYPTFEIPTNSANVPGTAAWKVPGIDPSTYPVGAFDLINYNDTFLADKWGEQLAAGGDLGLRGAFDYSWKPTQAGSLAQIAVEANEKAEQDYADLQAASGVFALIRLAGLLRYLSTPPLVSETINGNAKGSRIEVSETDVKASSPPIFPATVIEADATLKRYQAKSIATIITQEPGYTPAFQYRICLRTVDSKFGGSSWRNVDYVEDLWAPRYEKTASDQRNLCLVGETNIPALTNIVLYEGPAPLDTVHLSKKRVTLTASTFDWYVPVLGLYSELVGQKIDPWQTVAIKAEDKTTSAMKPMGGRSIHLDWPSVNPMKVMDSNAPLFNPVSELSALSDLSDVPYVLDEISLERAERRHVKKEEVHLDWELKWTGNQLQVRLAGVPEERPFQAYVVVEERVYSGNSAPDGTMDPIQHPGGATQIHTPLVAEIVNQLVMVPESFFTQEKKAIEAGEKLWDFTIKKYSESREVGPLDPVASLLSDVRRQLRESESTATLVDGLNARLSFMRNAMPALFEERLAEVRPAAPASVHVLEAHKRAGR